VKQRRSYKKVAEVWSKKLFGKTYTARSPLMLARHFYVSQFLQDNLDLKGKLVCDIGAGEGQFLDLIQKNYNASVFGIEPSKHNCSLLSGIGVKYFEGTIEEYVNSKECNPGFADIVTVMWTIENTTSPKDLLKAAHKLVKKNGHILIATGSRILVPFAKPLYNYLSTNPVDTHPSRFSINTLRSILSLTGFEIEKINPFMNDSLTMCVIARKINNINTKTITKDDYKQVADFFERWHIETTHYPKEI
jgi:2-polyprenyl-3-methyl-5-hydroxy-6-metoxy-1,4-benzoquinol methylase